MVRLFHVVYVKSTAKWSNQSKIFPHISRQVIAPAAGNWVDIIPS